MVSVSAEKSKSHTHDIIGQSNTLRQRKVQTSNPQTPAVIQPEKNYNLHMLIRHQWSWPKTLVRITHQTTQTQLIINGEVKVEKKESKSNKRTSWVIRQNEERPR